MANDDDDRDDEADLLPLGEGTVEYLDDVRKGKSRRFLMVCKGSKITFLAVKKKPVKAAELIGAKKEGYKGDGYYGLITGKGMDLVFNLSRADGYDTAPVKTKVLKDFLEEHAGFKCKPTIAIVATLPNEPRE